MTDYTLTLIAEEAAPALVAIALLARRENFVWMRQRTDVFTPETRDESESI